jgi:hypothetical protein
MRDASSFDGATWRKSTTSGDGNCVEVAAVPAAVGLRDSKDQQGPVVAMAPAAWTAFISEVRRGSFDL